MKKPEVKTLSTEMLQYLLSSLGNTPLYWNYTREELEAELKRRDVIHKS